MVPSITTVGAQVGGKQLKRASFRSPRPGPETDLVQRFLANAQLRAFADCRVTIFIEPKLEGCYPDIVMVAWRPSITELWRPERQSLESHDFRVLHYLVHSRKQHIDDLVGLFGISIRKRLDKLYIAGLVSKTKALWRARPLSRIFAAVAIIAVEAKISDWNTAVRQAFLNTWFASASYVLVPGSRTQTELISSASAHGIGILTSDSPLHFSRNRMNPRSYASWQLNEWAWRASLQVPDAN